MGSGDDRRDDWSLSTVELPAGADAFAFAMATGLTAGLQLGAYRLVRPLGEGAYAEVWLAVEQGELGFQKHVALKILKETATDQAALDSLINEARVCGMLHHPHIVDVYGVTQVDQFTFIAMEYVDGTTLEHLMQRVSRGGLQLPLAVIIDVAIGIAEALDHAHSAKGPDGEPLCIVHRDLKPGNVMLSRGAGVKVTDFGLAKATTNRNVTQAGQVRGTPGYIAPEVWQGTRDFTAGVDLWALGVMIWEMVVGEHMFDGTIIEVMSQAMNGDVDAEIGRLAAVRPKLARIARDLLQRSPESRTQTAWEATVALKELRSQLDAPGGLDLFLDLLVGDDDAKGASGARRRVVGARDRAWSALISVSDLSEEEQHRLREARSEVRRKRRADKIARSSTGKVARFDEPRRGLPPEAGWGLAVAVVGLGLWGWSRGTPPVVPDDPPVAVVAGLTPAPPEPVVADLTPAPPEPVVAVVVPEPTPRPPVPRPVVQPREPTPAPAQRTPAPAQPTPAAPTPPEPTPAPPAPASDGCVVFQSFPPGADVTVNGSPSGLVALGGETARRAYRAGSLDVTMGSDTATLATVVVSVAAGTRTVVRCDLMTGKGCTVRAAPGSCD